MWNLSKQSIFFNHFLYSYLILLQYFNYFLQEWTLNLSVPELFILIDRKSIPQVSALNNPIGLFLAKISMGSSFSMGQPLQISFLNS